jgi:alkanesulfonate monooxygenase SsuD/methylene tetrahydromethanopterin reductase-like flavin-dependent oxidoreductase (luciferase family)
VQESLSSAAIGAVEQVRTRVLDIAADYAVDEIVVLTICHDPAARARSYKLLAEAIGVSAVSPTRAPVEADASAG